MSIKLYKQDFSPVARAAMAVCDIFNVPVEFVDVNLMEREQFKPEFLKLNPCHTIPVLVDGDLVIEESVAILMYVAEVYGKNSPMYPSDIKKRTRINNQLLFANGTLFFRLRNISYGFLAENQKGITQNQIRKVEEAASFLEEYLTRSKFLALDHITIADIMAFAVFCSYPTVISLDKYPKINAWMKEMEQQPYSQKHIVKGAKIVDSILESAKKS